MITNTVVRVHQHGGPDCLTLDELPLQPIESDQLLIEVEAAGVNFFDTQLRSGLYKQPLPLALGTEGAGIVQEAGANANGFRAGDRVRVGALARLLRTLENDRRGAGIRSTR